MNCDEFESRMQNCLDQRLAALPVELRRHVEGCVPCQEMWASLRHLLAGVEAWNRTVPPIDLAERIIWTDLIVPAETASVEQVPPGIQRRPMEFGSLGLFSRILVATSAAALCFMFWSSDFSSEATSTRRSLARRRGANSSRDLSVVSSTRPHTNNDRETTPDRAGLETVLASAEGAYSHLAEETAAVAQDFALLIPKGGLFRSAAVPNMQIETPASQSGGLLPANVYPVGDSVENALQFLWQSVPGVEKRS